MLNHNRCAWMHSERAHAEWRAASPFPHVCLDDLIAEGSLLVAARAAQNYTPDMRPERHKHCAGKSWINDWGALPATVADLINDLSRPLFLDALQSMTGIRAIPDPYLGGAGLHYIAPGGRLGIHVDYNFHRLYRLDRRLNLMLYLNEGWREEWGGAIELWEGDKERPHRKVASYSPTLGRAVIFETSETSWHGHPHPLACPDGVRRVALALYYYSNGRPIEQIAPQHTTRYRAT